MSLVFESDAVRQRPTEAATHVLIVGCGAYPSGAITSLTSTIVSAKAMAVWFLSGRDAAARGQALSPDRAFFNPSAPLGTVELLLSQPGAFSSPSGEQFVVEEPTINNISNAYERWLDRLGDNPNSRGIFHFCGHGVGDGAVQFLVADDYGTTKFDLSKTSFHLPNTVQVSARRTAAGMLFLVDACCEFFPDALNRFSTPQPLVDGLREGALLSQEWLVIGAAITNERAYGIAHECSRFTSALLLAFGGHCGRNAADTDDFHVTPTALREALGPLLKHVTPPDDYRYQKLGMGLGAGNWDQAIHVLTSRPKAIVELDVEPNGFRAIATGYAHRTDSPREVKPMSPSPTFTIEQGDCVFGTEPVPPGTQFAAKRIKKLLITPIHKHCFKLP